MSLITRSTYDPPSPEPAPVPEAFRRLATSRPPDHLSLDTGAGVYRERVFQLDDASLSAVHSIVCKSIALELRKEADSFDPDNADG